MSNPGSRLRDTWFFHELAIIHEQPRNLGVFQARVQHKYNLTLLETRDALQQSLMPSAKRFYAPHFMSLPCTAPRAGIAPTSL